MSSIMTVTVLSPCSLSLCWSDVSAVSETTDSNPISDSTATVKIMSSHEVKCINHHIGNLGSHFGGTFLFFLQDLWWNFFVGFSQHYIALQSIPWYFNVSTCSENLQFVDMFDLRRYAKHSEARQFFDMAVKNR